MYLESFKVESSGTLGATLEQSMDPMNRSPSAGHQETVIRDTSGSVAAFIDWYANRMYEGWNIGRIGTFSARIRPNEALS